MHLSVFAYLVLGASACITGISKTGIPGLGLLGVAFTPMVIPAKVSTGYILPFLIFGDIIAIAYWRKSVVWRYIILLVPAMLVGILAGYASMAHISEEVYGKVLGGLVILILMLDLLRRHCNISIPADSRPAGWTAGFLAGVLTMMANAAGPVTIVYLLAMNISKEEFVGTSAWLFFMINLFKVPFSANLGLITFESLKVNVVLFPCIIVGAFIGVTLIHRLSGRAFEMVARILAFAGGIKLLF